MRFPATTARSAAVSVRVMLCTVWAVPFRLIAAAVCMGVVAAEGAEVPTALTTVAVRVPPCATSGVTLID